MITMSSNSQLKSILYIYVPQVHLVFNICIEFFFAFKKYVVNLKCILFKVSLTWLSFKKIRKDSIRAMHTKIRPA